jgi:hypothetical protein
MSLDLFNLSFNPCPVLVDHDGEAVENTIAADHPVLAVPAHKTDQLPDLSVGLATAITSNVHLCDSLINHEALVANPGFQPCMSHR